MHRQPAIDGDFQPVPDCPLPVFMGRRGSVAVFYAPRLACTLPGAAAAEVVGHVRDLSSQESAGSETPEPPQPPARQAAARLVRSARAAVRESAAMPAAPFRPECLTVFPGLACNLRCRYCYSAPAGLPGESVSDDAVRAAARRVAGVCSERGKPFTFVLHGGGEPTLDAAGVERMLGIAAEEAARAGVPLRTYLATNGVMPERMAHWLAGHIDLIGVSCDGPPDVHDRQRPGADGGPTSPQVHRTLMLLRQQGKPFHVRSTLTRESFGDQARIVSYLAETYAPAEIRLEPVYANPLGPGSLTGLDAACFVDGFMAARRAAGSPGIRVTTSLTRPASVHGPYCNVLRQVLNLAPGDVATGCFLTSREADITARGVRTGALRPDRSGFAIDAAVIRSLAERGSRIPPTCRHCMCEFQCTRGCPDGCILDSENPDTGGAALEGSFRCQAGRRLLTALVREAAGLAWEAAAPGTCRDFEDPHTGLCVTAYRDGRDGDPRT